MLRYPMGIRNILIKIKNLFKNRVLKLNQFPRFGFRYTLFGSLREDENEEKWNPFYYLKSENIFLFLGILLVRFSNMKIQENIEYRYHVRLSFFMAFHFILYTYIIISSYIHFVFIPFCSLQILKLNEIE